MKQLVFYHTILTTHKVVVTGKPVYLHDKLCRQHSHNTRTSVRFGENFGGRSALASASFCYRGALTYNTVPQNIRQIENIDTFKKHLKKWTMENVEIP